MKLLLPPIAFIPLALAGCGTSTHVDKLFTVPELVANIDTLNGRTVSVTGYLGTCAGYECELFVDEAGRDAWRRHIDAISRRASPQPEAPLWLGIGHGDGFDRKAAPFQNRNVTITGKVTNRCRYFGHPACADRSTDIEPVDIIPSKDN
ncbi:MAG: hypothetical protein WC804_19695 [Sphingomonas sp.]|jgi:hypothetical protein|uniref:hypothetical protein n=1 Tax=Sphingomonas sp. TaxID=28214 RepID=UPI0035675AD4